jgi:transketolase
MKDESYFSHSNKTGRNIHFGVREHAMGKIVNGMSLHGGFVPYGATFLVFSDFMRPAIRMAALMEIQSIFILTHDSIALGEDGPTHQPIEQTMSLRMIPGLSVYRPADALETAVAWQAACMNKKNPTALLLTRQKLPVLHEYSKNIYENAHKGGYIISAGEDKAKATIIATGSEVALALEAQKALAKENISVNVVSMLAMDVFDKQSDEYREMVIPNEIPTIAVEAGSTLGWSKYTKNEKNNIGINTFGASAPGPVLYEKFGFTVENVVKHVKAALV